MMSLESETASTYARVVLLITGSFFLLRRDLPVYQVEIQQQSDIATARNLNPLIMGAPKVKGADYVEVDDGDATDVTGGEPQTASSHITSSIGGGFLMGSFVLVTGGVGPAIKQFRRSTLPTKVRRTSMVNFLTSKAKRGALMGAGFVLSFASIKYLISSVRRDDFLTTAMSGGFAGGLWRMIRTRNLRQSVKFGAMFTTGLMLGHVVERTYHVYAPDSFKEKVDRLISMGKDPLWWKTAKDASAEKM